MRLRKAVIAELAIEGYALKTGRGGCFRTNNCCGSIEYAFTKDVTEEVRDDLVETMKSIEAALGYKEQLFFPGEMGSVTRDKELWDK